MILIIGDLHFKTKEPYKTKYIEFIEDLYKSYPDSTLIFTGDFFDKSNPHSEDEVDSILDYVLKFKSVHIVTGNHEISNRTGNPLAPLNRISNLHIYRVPTHVEIDGIKFLMLPYLYNMEEMKNYNAITETTDYVVSHVAYPGTNRGAPDEINLSSIKAKAWFYGHIHEPQDFGLHHIIGVPNTTRHGEQDWQKRMVVIENGTYRFQNLEDKIRFETISFGAEPDSKDSILNVIDAPSVQAVLKKYKQNYIRKQGIKILEENSDSVSYNTQKEFLNFSLESNFQIFRADIELRVSVETKINELFTLVPE
jgi:predicted phosphodiesterase